MVTALSLVVSTLVLSTMEQKFGDSKFTRFFDSSTTPLPHPLITWVPD